MKGIVGLIIGTNNELRERMLRSVLFVSGAAVIAAIVEILLAAGIEGILRMLLLGMLAVAAGTLFAAFRYRRYNEAAVLLGVIMLAGVFPVMFFVRGGIHSGAAVWMALGIMYIFMMFRGRKLFFFLLLCAAVYAGIYWTAYQYPELLYCPSTELLLYWDSFLAVWEVGLVGGILIRAQVKGFEQEHLQNIEKKQELEKNSDTKNTFFANMSHEIRTPINAIIGLNEMILRENPSGNTREYAMNIQSAGKLLLNQVNDILDLSQMEMQKMKLVPIRYKTEELFGELAELVRVQMEKKGLTLFAEIDSGLPSVLYGDEKRLKQVLLNILDNAVKYTEEGSVTMSVSGEETDSGELSLRVSISDTGIGIRKEDIGHLYDSFNRADEQKNHHIAGSGLGLAITKQLVDLMEGEITVDSIYTKGTIFTVIIRQGIADAKPLGEVNLSGRVIEAGEDYHPSFEAPEARILIVDDNSMNSLVAGKLLSATKVQTDTAESGEKCLELAKKKYYHVILLDYMMPGMDGVQTLKALRVQEEGLCRETAVIALTGNAVSGARQQYDELGFDGYVEKPIQGTALEREVLKFLPEDIIEYREEGAAFSAADNLQTHLALKKRKKIYITSDCACDLPAELLEKYDIKLMYLYVKTPNGRFADTKEIDSDSLAQYISSESSCAFADSVTVEEYEEFFAEVLTQAERVIHISLGSRCGESYNIAVAAAKGFDHVHIIDSGQISCGQGLLTLYAAELAMEGQSAGEICAALEKKRGMIQTRIIMPGADIFYQNGRTGQMTVRLCRVLQLHPYVVMKQRKAVLAGLLAGNLEKAWKQGISWHMRRKRRIDKRLVIITHVGCNVKQQEWIKNEVLKRVCFEQVIVQKASFSNACNSGMETIGIAYFVN